MSVNDKKETKTPETAEAAERLPDAAETMPVPARIRTPWTDACARFRRNPVGVASAVLVAALFLLSFLEACFWALASALDGSSSDCCAAACLAAARMTSI